MNRDITTMNQAALVLAVFSLLSQLFGLLRDRLLASMVGPSAALDVYYAAFRIPDFIYVSVASLFSVTVIIPFITGYLDEKDTGKAASLKKFSDTLFTVYCAGMVMVCIVAAVLMPYLTRLTAPGFSAVQHADLILYSRIMLLSAFLMGLSSLLGSFAQVQKKFFSFAIAPLFYNLGILMGVIVLLPILGIFGVVIGVVVGAALYMVVQLPTLITLGKLPVFTRTLDLPLIKQVILLSIPRTLAMSLTNLTMLMMSAVASLLVAGSISIFQLSYNIETAPLMIIGISYAVAAFPTMTRLFMDGQKKEFVDLIHRATRNIFFLSVPAAILIIVLRAQIVRVLLGAGVFSWNDTRLVAASVALFCLSVTAQCMILLLVRGFYAAGNTKTPLFINAYSVLITIGSLGVLLLCFREFPLFKDFLENLLRIDGASGTSVVLLPLAFSIGQIANAIFLWTQFHNHLEGHKSETTELGRALFHTVGAGIIAGTSAYGMLLLLGSGIDQEHFLGVFVQGTVAGIVGVSMYGITLMAMRNEDIVLFIETVRSKFWKQKPLTPEQPEL
ncbi:MAG: murein biosynthesis integral membrane protein MurJ [Minisyncoccia bacterium]